MEKQDLEYWSGQKRTEEEYQDWLKLVPKDLLELMKSDPAQVFGNPNAQPIFINANSEQFFQFDEDVDDEFFGMALLENLQRKQFPLKDLGITSRVFNHWKQQGLVPGSEDGKWAYFDFIQYLWLMMVKDLRGFGLPLETIVAVKDYLFDTEFMQKAQLSSEDKAKIRKELEKKAKRRLTEQEFEDATEVFRTGNTYIPYLLTLIVLNHITYRTNTNLLIFMDGKTEVRNEYLDSFEKQQQPVATQPHLVIPLAKYFAAFMSDETKAEFLPVLPFISPQENQVLQAMRDNNIKELTLVFIENGKDKRIDLITKKDGEISPEKISRFTELLASNKSIKITMKTKVGENLYYQIEKRRSIR